MALSLPIRFELNLLFYSGTRWGPVNLPGQHLLRAFPGGSAQSQFRALIGYLQSAKEMYEVPSFVGLNDIGKGWHRCAVKTGPEDLVEVLVSYATLEARAHGKVIQANGLVVAVRECRGRRTISAAFLAMALPTFQFLEKFLPMLDALHG